uniref:KIB1-4 beta-propeller domain-containing protein n=1 Tax=Aegilops tauschii TaxID=37682 RepID=M8D7J2_AEGTA
MGRAAGGCGLRAAHLWSGRGSTSLEPWMWHTAMDLQGPYNQDQQPHVSVRTKPSTDLRLLLVTSEGNRSGQPSGVIAHCATVTSYGSTVAMVTERSSRVFMSKDPMVDFRVGEVLWSSARVLDSCIYLATLECVACCEAFALNLQELVIACDASTIVKNTNEGSRFTKFRLAVSALEHAVRKSKFTHRRRPGRMRLVKPVTGEQRTLPAITIMPCLVEQEQCGQFVLDLKHFVRAQPHNVYEYRPSDWTHRIGAHDMCAKHMRSFCRKVVLSNSPPCPAAMMITGTQFGFVVFATAEGGAWRLARDGFDLAKTVVLSNSPPCPAAMMITGTQFGFVVFATAEGGAWRLARDGFDLAKTVCGTTPSPESSADAIHYEGRFYSITYSGQVEAWEHDTHDVGVFRSVVVAPRLLLPVDLDHRSGEEWRETDNIGDAALFVGGKSSLCVPTREHPELKAGCVYYASEGYANDCATDLVRVFSLKGGRAEKVEGLGRRRTRPRPVWFTPCIP